MEAGPCSGGQRSPSCRVELDPFLEIAPALYGRSTTDWKTLLAHFLTRYVQGGTTYSRPNRRQAWRSDVIVPANRYRNAGRGFLIVDTSGSMSLEQRLSALGELEKILQCYPKTQVDLLQCDQEICGEIRHFSVWDFPLREQFQWKGGRWTDLSPPSNTVPSTGINTTGVFVSPTWSGRFSKWRTQECQRSGWSRWIIPRANLRLGKSFTRTKHRSSYEKHGTKRKEIRDLVGQLGKALIHERWNMAKQAAWSLAMACHNRHNTSIVMR